MLGQITLIGMMGAGKSAIGLEMSRQLGVPYRDSDAEIERAAAMSITEIFARDGEDFFRDRETEVLGRILAGPHGIVSTGGGAWMRPQNRKTISAAGLSVWLNVNLATLWQRVKQRPTRPLLQTKDPKGTLTRLLDERGSFYALADLTFDAGGSRNIEQSAAALIEMIEAERPGFLRGK